MWTPMRFPKREVPRLFRLDTLERMASVSPRLSPFGQQLRAQCRQRGLSQVGLALRAGTTPRHVSFIEAVDRFLRRHVCQPRREGAEPSVAHDDAAQGIHRTRQLAQLAKA
jgi:hypothetical protein